eukprot:TRINITY_DN219_c0_g1_i1.p1 TRINITY_DN219_c0_g1~~TRINITY_DN219_c0_g1_i1.p1  ORF type:complete len:198 (+),score=34.18 TRINITY_DN219_c0_g1_i1:55-648(+)
MPVKWFWKSDLRKDDSDDSAWTEYAVAQIGKIEKGFRNSQTKKGKKTMTMGKYIIDFENEIQRRADDDQLQRGIKRVEVDSDSDSDSDGSPSKKRTGTCSIKKKLFVRGPGFDHPAYVAKVIEEMGGLMTPNVTSTTDYVLCPEGDKFDAGNAKLSLARKFRVPVVLLPEDFSSDDNKKRKSIVLTAMERKNMVFYD